MRQNYQGKWIEVKFRHLIHHLFQVSFGLFLMLMLMTPSWREGIFTWFPIWQVEMLAGETAVFGVLTLLPIIFVSLRVCEFACLRVANGPLAVGRRQSPIMYGDSENRTSSRSTFILFAFFFLIVVRLSPDLSWRTVTQVGGVLLAGLVYFGVWEQRPCLTPWLASVVVAQSSVAIGQFVAQSDLGLQFFAELPLDPTIKGISVIGTLEQPWLRGYGLTAHPNLLGAMLTTLLLWLLPRLSETSRRERCIYTAVFLVGLGGLFVSFSRGAWLGFGIGGGVWLLIHYRHSWRDLLARHWRFVLVVGGLFLLVMLFYRDLIIGRVAFWETPIELFSLSERWWSIQVALEVIAEHGLWGVGAGNFLKVAQMYHPEAAPVHNIPLLVWAELGLPGLALWLWLAVWGGGAWGKKRPCPPGVVCWS